MKKVKVPEAEKLPSGSYRCRVMVKGKSQSFTGPSKAEVERMARDYKEGVLAVEENQKPQARTVGNVIDGYIEKRKVALSPSTLRGYKTIRENYFPSIMDVDFGLLTDAKLQKAIASDTHSPKTLKNALQLVLSACAEEGRTFKVYTPKVIPNERAFLQPEEIQPFIKAANGEPCEMAILLGLHGLRRSEMCVLRRENVDTKAGVIYVRGAVVYGEGSKIVQKPENKNASSRRTVPIMIPRLKELIEPIADPQASLITVTPNTIGEQLESFCKKHSMRKITPHGLRHSFCSLAYHLGISEKVAMQIGGWSDYNTMRKIYTHVADSDISKSVKSMTEFLST